MDDILHIAELRWQPQRSDSECQRQRAQAEPQLVREQMERQLPVLSRPKVASFPATGRVFFYLPNPTAKHFAHVFKRRGKDFIFCCGKRLDFPSDLEKNL